MDEDDKEFELNLQTWLEESRRSFIKYNQDMNSTSSKSKNTNAADTQFTIIDPVLISVLNITSTLKS